MNDEELAEAILAYLAEHPQAMDSVEGIAQWWIPRQQIYVNVTTLMRALQGLTEKGLLEEFAGKGHRLYRLKDPAICGPAF